MEAMRPRLYLFVLILFGFNSHKKFGTIPNELNYRLKLIPENFKYLQGKENLTGTENLFLVVVNVNIIEKLRRIKKVDQMFHS